MNLEGILAQLAAMMVALVAAPLLAFALPRTRAAPLPPTDASAPPPAPVLPRIDTTALHNAARFGAMKQALASGSTAEAERLIAQCDRDKVPNVNICPPADFKPDATDGYCVRCEGFAECSARLLRARLATTAATSVRAPTAAPAAAPPEPAPLV